MTAVAPAGSVGVDWLVAGAQPAAALADRVAWLLHVVAWLSGAGGDGGDDTGGVKPATRLRFLLTVLDRHPDRKVAFARTVRATLREQSGVRLLCETGLPRANAFLQELTARLAAKMLPPPPGEDLAALVRRAFPKAGDAAWIADLPGDLLADVAALLAFAPGEREPSAWSSLLRDIEDALLILAAQVQAIGLSSRVRGRTAVGRIFDSPFAGITGAVREYVATLPGSAERAPARAELASRIARCRRAVAEVMGHLEQYGVSTDLVYQLERARMSLKRMERLAALHATEAPGPDEIAAFVGMLASTAAAEDSVRVLVRENTGILARRLVESAHRTGEHYLTRDRVEYRAMLKAAAIGGLVMGLVVIIKYAAVNKGLPPFPNGLVASLNYALAFVAIHMLHGTVATKQPAMTAATMAVRLNMARHRGRLRAFVGDVESLIRSQVASILGNLVLVVPAALAIQWLILLLGGGHLPDRDHAQHYVDALSILGPTPLYAAFTGVLLWFSAVLGGWFENWAIYRKLPEAIAASPWLVNRLGAVRARRVTDTISRNFSALGANVSLGFMLGMVPEIAGFFGLPLEVRHVTLSTGQLALASYSLGPAVFATAAFWLACAGIAVNGVLNLAVSFGLAFWVALRATAVGRVSRRRLLRAILGRILRRPRAFLLPPREAAPAPGVAQRAD